MKNNYKKIGEVAHVTMGLSPGGDTYNRDGIGLPLLNGPTEFGAFSPRCTLYTTDSKRECVSGDLIFCVRGNTTGRMNWADRSYSLGRGVCSIRGETCIDTKYIKYCIEIFLPELLQMTGGSTMPNLNQMSIKQFLIPYYPHRNKITTIISPYDDLIENNLRRIKILEKKAQSLYREWFVNFRFPGHEKVRMVDSPLGQIPEGWDVCELDKVAEIIDCLHSKKPKAQENGVGTLLQLNNIGENGKLDIRSKYLINAEDYRLWTSRIELREGDCVITNVGRIGAVAQIPVEVKAAPGRNMTGVRPHPEYITPTYLIEYLLSPHMDREISLKKDAGTIMDSLNVKGIKRLNIPCPPRTLLDEFEKNARPMRRMIEVLLVKNHCLINTRDLLLPKLISGEVDVSDLNIMIPEEA